MHSKGSQFVSVIERSSSCLPVTGRLTPSDFWRLIAPEEESVISLTEAWWIDCDNAFSCFCLLVILVFRRWICRCFLRLLPRLHRRVLQRSRQRQLESRAFRSSAVRWPVGQNMNWNPLRRLLWSIRTFQRCGPSMSSMASPVLGSEKHPLNSVAADGTSDVSCSVALKNRLHDKTLKNVDMIVIIKLLFLLIILINYQLALHVCLIHRT